MSGDLHRACPVCNGTGTVVIPIGHRVRKMREERGLTQDQMAQQLGISRASIANIEAGKQDVTSVTLATMHKLYGVSLDWLFGIAERPPASRALTGEDTDRKEPPPKQA